MVSASSRIMNEHIHVQEYVQIHLTHMCTHRSATANVSRKSNNYMIAHVPWQTEVQNHWYSSVTHTVMHLAEKSTLLKCFIVSATYVVFYSIHYHH
jgi:hypothetical protein